MIHGKTRGEEGRLLLRLLLREQRPDSRYDVGQCGVCDGKSSQRPGKPFRTFELFLAYRMGN
jgi:hypothetical protein